MIHKLLHLIDDAENIIKAQDDSCNLYKSELIEIYESLDQLDKKLNNKKINNENNFHSRKRNS